MSGYFPAPKAADDVSNKITGRPIHQLCAVSIQLLEFAVPVTIYHYCRDEDEIRSSEMLALQPRIRRFLQVGGSVKVDLLVSN